MNILFIILFLINPGNKNVAIENAWIRNSAEGMNTALFFDVKNNGNKADTLYKVECSAAELVQIHETFTEGDMMGMREVKNVVINAGQIFNFKPRSHHVMLIKLKKDLKEGDKESVTFYFSNSGKIKMDVQVKKMIK